MLLGGTGDIMNQTSHPQTFTQGEVTLLLERWVAGERHAIDELLPLVYGELRSLAARYLGRERHDHTLPPTGLVHEAYLRLVGSDLSAATLENRIHFFAVAAQAMRRILVEHARRYQAVSRPSPKDRVVPEDFEAWGTTEPQAIEILALDQALEDLRRHHPRQARVVELRHFGGLTEDDIAQVLGVSRITVARDWRVARLLLSRALAPEPSG